MYDVRKDTYFRYNPKRAARRFSPCSTFKIANTLIGLETGAVPDEKTIVKWDREKHPREDWWDEVLKPMGIDWARDHNLTTAFAQSVVWFYRDMANRIGREEMGTFLERFDYGNRDMSGGLDAFWLESTLEISADEQVEFLKKVQDEKLGLSARTMEIARRVFVAEEGDGYTLRAKTGSGSGGDGEYLGWYVGWIERGEDVYVFAFNLSGDTPDIQKKRVPLARAILEELGALVAAD